MVVGIAEAGAALGSIKTAIDMLRGVRSLSSEADINQAIIDIQRTLLEAQASALEDRARQMALLDRIDALESQLSEKTKWETDQARYRLTEFSSGRFAYVFEPDCAGSEPSHKLCAKCFGEGKKSILQTVHKHSGGESVYCQNCKEKMILQDFQHETVHTAPRARSWIDDY